MAANDGGPAFPQNDATVNRTNNHDGMSLRQYAAIELAAGMLAADGNDPRWAGKDTGPEHQRGGGKWLDPKGLAVQAVEIADALLAELAK